MRIAIVGAGGVGGYYGGVLARAGHDVAMLARGDHLEALRAEGITVRMPDGSGFTASVSASDRVEELGAPDLVLVAVKAYSLPEVAPAVARLAEEGGVILPLLNGVDIVDRLVELGVPRASLLAGLTYISAARVEPGVIERRSDFQRIVVGEPGAGESERARRTVAAFADTPVEARVSGDIETELWRKLVFIATLAATCGLARSAIGAVREAPGGETLIRRAAGEVVAVARSRGAGVEEGETESVVGRILELDPGMRPSFLLDVEAGGATELDVLSGAISRLGAASGVPTPIHDTARTALAASTDG